MSKFKEYKDKYDCVHMERRDGILQLTLHTNGGPLVWASGPHEDLGYCFTDVATDIENKLVILTGTEDEFIAQRQTRPAPFVASGVWDRTLWEGKRLLMNLLDIEVPMIAAVNGPATIHAELAVLCDIVLAAEHAVFQDSHFPRGVVPGDGVHVVWPLVLGPNLGRHFLLTGQVLTAQRACDLGVVAEVLPKDELLNRAWELGRELASQPTLTLRYSRVALVQPLKRALLNDLEFGLALEGLAAGDSWPG